ncbi:MAG: serine/threonine protein kinase, partial [Myxococcales bacterium]|nr:serine/threonine protein kinase [Myxococcales bacterium]
SVIGGKFALLRRLGSGAAAEVFEAENLLVGKRVALKLLHPEHSRRADVRGHFVSEARAAARIAHPNVVDIHDLGTTADGSAYMVMELLEGESLADILSTRGTLSPAYACELMIQVLAGIGAAHRQGIVHRDLKPANIVVTHPAPDRPLVKVLDFGIAQGVNPLSNTEANGGLVFGTPLYMAPEQAMGRTVDSRADIYASAVVLYEMLCGEAPYSAPDVRGLMLRVAQADWVPLALRAPELHPGLVACIERALSRDPENRPETAEQFARELEPFARLALAMPSALPSVNPIPLVRRSEQRESGVRLSLHSSRNSDLSDEQLMNPSFPKPPFTPQLVEDALPYEGMDTCEFELEQAQRQASTWVPTRTRRPSPVAWIAVTGVTLGALCGWLLSQL